MAQVGDVVVPPLQGLPEVPLEEDPLEPGVLVCKESVSGRGRAGVGLLLLHSPLLSELFAPEAVAGGTVYVSVDADGHSGNDEMN